MSKLRFKVIACSSEDPAFPARELNEHASNSKGYLTAKNCEYPQEVVLKLQDGLSRVTQIQILSHQSHIGSKIELFLSKSSHLQDAHFSRLGYLTLKSNVESNYLARELKTVHIDHEANFIKLLLHQCYINERNIYSQVGIMAVNLCGDVIEEEEGGGGGRGLTTGELGGDELTSNSSSTNDLMTRSISKPRGNGGPSGAEDMAFDLRFDAKTAERIREIHLAKERAVAMEDYDQAKRLKVMEEQLKSIGLQLARLEQQKRDAVANEDYDLAKRIKDEISALESSVGSNDTVRNSQALPSTRYQNNGNISARGSPRDRDYYGEETPVGRHNQPPPSQQQPPPLRSSNMSNRQNAYSEDTVVGGGNGGGGNTSSRSSGRNGGGGRQAVDDEGGQDDYENDNRGGNANGPSTSSGSNPNFQGIPEAENLPDPDEIPDALMKESEEMIDVIGDFFTRCFYSNLWNHRDAAIRKVTMDLDQYDQDPFKILQVCSTLVQSGTGDRIAQVALSSYRLLERMISYGSKFRREEMQRLLANTMTQLVNKLGEAQAKVRDETQGLLVFLASTKNIGVTYVTSHVTKRSKKPLGLKFLSGRLFVLKELLSKFELIGDSDFSMPGLMSFLEENNCFAHQSREIRDLTRELTVSLFLMVGPDVEGYLKSLRPKQLEEYQAAFEAAETARASSSGRNGTRSSNNNSTAKKTAGGRRQDHPPEEEDDQGYEDEYEQNSGARRGGGGSGSGSGSGSGNAQRSGGSNGGRGAPKRHQEEEHEEQEDEEESVDEFTCPFCGIVDETFDSDRLDQHFWADCRMLTPCKMCGQVIEIAGLNEHLLIECELKKNHRECPRCGEAITSKFYEKHVSLNDCLPKPHPRQANRCPLCHEDILPGKKGWSNHLLQETCPNNPRN